MKKILILTIAFFAITIAQANTPTVAETTPPTENNSEFVAIKIEDLDEEVQKNIRKLLYDEGFMLRRIYQHPESKDIKVIAVSNEASVVTFMFDKEGKEKV